MIFTIVILFLTFVFLTFLGYSVHRMFHSPWSGRFYRSHKNHHFQQYPADNLVSDVYRDAGADNTFWLFFLCFSPFIISNIVLTILGIIPIILGVGIFIEMAIVSFINDRLHDSFHITKTFWHRFWFFDRLQKLHFLHHFDVNSNFGIFSFFWDRLFGTYQDIER
jgi:sterol desaturase/sphingolipid hydroxylase (fatty acid hydroxylase superfamily)